MKAFAIIYTVYIMAIFYYHCQKVEFVGLSNAVVKLRGAFIFFLNVLAIVRILFYTLYIYGIYLYIYAVYVLSAAAGWEHIFIYICRCLRCSRVRVEPPDTWGCVCLPCRLSSCMRELKSCNRILRSCNTSLIPAPENTEMSESTW